MMVDSMKQYTFSEEDKASLLIEALPYIQQFHGKTVVIMYDGKSMTDPQLQAQFMKDIVLMKYVGIKLVIVHGGGSSYTELLESLHCALPESLMEQGSNKLLQQFAEQLAREQIGQHIVGQLNRLGLSAVGLSGKDGDLLFAKQKSDGLEITAIKTELIDDLLDKGYIPVITAVATDESQGTFIMKADDVAAELSGVLGAEKLVLLTDIKGIYMDFPIPTSFISSLSKREIMRLVEKNVIKEDLIPKAMACVKAIDKGTTKACIVDGRKAHALLLEFFTNAGVGTEVFGGN